MIELKQVAADVLQTSSDPRVLERHDKRAVEPSRRQVPQAPTYVSNSGTPSQGNRVRKSCCD